MPENTDGTSLAKATAGCNSEATVISPFRKFNNIHVPLAVVSHRGLSWQAKILYGVIAWHVGKGSVCFARLDTLASEMGASVDCIGRALKELSLVGLVRRRRQGPGNPAICELLDHPILVGSLRMDADSAEVRNLDSAEVRSKIPQIRGSDSAEVRSLYKEEENPEENHRREPSSSAVHSVPGSDRTMEFSFISENLNAFLADRGYRRPSGQNPLHEVAKLLTDANAGESDFVQFLRDYGKRLHDAPATWRHVVSSLTNWLQEPDRVRARKHAADMRHEMERREALRDTEMPLAEAKRAIECQRVMCERYESGHPKDVFAPSINSALLDELRDHGTERMTPRALLRAMQSWKPCQKCEGSGTIALDATAFVSVIRWCDCPAAARKRRHDPAYVERENARTEAFNAAANTLLSNPGKRRVESYLPKRPPTIQRAGEIMAAAAGSLS